MQRFRMIEGRRGPYSRIIGTRDIVLLFLGEERLRLHSCVLPMCQCERHARASMELMTI